MRILMALMQLSSAAQTRTQFYTLAFGVSDDSTVTAPMALWLNCYDAFTQVRGTQYSIVQTSIFAAVFDNWF
jgi:hypothetical protein